MGGETSRGWPGLLVNRGSVVRRDSGYGLPTTVALRSAGKKCRLDLLLLDSGGNIIVRSMADPSQKQWFFYLARCADGSLYSGIAVDPVKRMEVHNAGKGARYTRSRLPVVMVYSEPQPDQSSALRREAVVRKWARKKKESLITGTLADEA